MEDVIVYAFVILSLLWMTYFSLIVLFWLESNTTIVNLLFGIIESLSDNLITAPFGLVLVVLLFGLWFLLPIWLGVLFAEVGKRYKKRKQSLKVS